MRLADLRVWRDRGWTVYQQACPADGGWHHITTTLERGWLTTYLDGHQLSSVLVGWRALLRRVTSRLRFW